MTEPFEDLAGLDKLIHEPARLAIATALSAAESADFLYLQRLTGLSKGNLSAHLSKLEEAGLVEIDKHFVGKKPHTNARLSDAGQNAVTAYWQRIDDVRERTRRWRPSERSPRG